MIDGDYKMRGDIILQKYKSFCTWLRSYGKRFFVSICILIAILAASFFLKDIPWMQSIGFPVILSAFASIGVSLWFTYKSDKKRIYYGLKQDIKDIILNTTPLFHKTIDSIVFLPYLPNIQKKRQVYFQLLHFPSAFYLEKAYPKFWEYYKDRHNQVLDLLENMKIEDDASDFNEAFILSGGTEIWFIMIELQQRAIQLQEQFKKDYSNFLDG